jgi:hypothetical protein
MENQINVGGQRQSYEPFEQADSEAENSGAEASLAGDSAGANTSGNPDVANAQVDGESVNQTPPETVVTNNTLNRYGIGDTVILGRPEYAFNDRATIAETTFAANEIAEAAPFAMPAAIPTGFIPAPALQSDPAQICPDETEPASSGLETAATVNATSAAKAPVDAASNAKDVTNGSAPATQRGTKLPPSDSVAFTAAREYGAQHGFDAQQVDQVAAIFAYYNCTTAQDCKETLECLPYHIGTIMQGIGWNSDGVYHVGLALRNIQEAERTIAGDPNAANGNLYDLAGLGSPFLEGRSRIVRAGAGQGEHDYANEMSASQSVNTSYFDLGDDYSNESYDASSSYDAYDPANSTPQIDLDPLPSLPPLDSSGPMMLPEPEIYLDHELAPLPSIGVQSEAERTLAPQDADATQTSDRTSPGISETTVLGDSTVGTSTRTDTGQGGAVSGNQPGNDTTVSDATADASRPLYGFNTDGQPLFSTGSKPPQGEYRAAPDAPNLMAGDPVLRADATGATPLRDENGTLYYRVNGGAMDGQIIYVQSTTPTAQNEKPATTLETGGTADRSGDIALGFAPLTLGSTATSRLGAQLASQVLAAEMEFGPPQLRLAGAATLTGVALWAAGRQNTEYEALSPEELDRLRQPLINVPPPPLPPWPGLVPPPVPDNSTLPGTSTDKPIRPTDLSNPIPQPQSWQDLIVTNGNADNNRSRAQERYNADPSLTDPNSLLGQQVPGVGTWIAPPTPRGDRGADYEEQITGTPSGIELNVGGTIRTTPNGTPTASGGANFEGVRTEGNTTVLIDAKDWSNFLPEGQRWWIDQVTNEAGAQLGAIGGLDNVRIEWVVSTQREADAVIEALRERGYEDDIDVVVVPKKGN